MNTKTQPAKDESTTAQVALFQMQFAVEMLNCGRTETANQCFENAQKALQELIDAGH